jgi:hypothetical protein
MVQQNEINVALNLQKVLNQIAKNGQTLATRILRPFTEHDDM